jgi:hypothetical protein
MVGDREVDLMLGERGAAGGILVRSGYGELALSESEPSSLDPVRVFPDVLAAVTHLIATAWSSENGECT